MTTFSPKEEYEYSKVHTCALLPDSLWCKVPIYKSKELTERIPIADSLTVLVVCGEQNSVVCSRKVHIVINRRQINS